MKKVHDPVVKFHFIDGRLIVSSETAKGSKPILTHDLGKKKAKRHRK